MEWRHRTGITALCQVLDVKERDYRLARTQIGYVYIEKVKVDRKSGKARHLCYPPERRCSTAFRGGSRSAF